MRILPVTLLLVGAYAADAHASAFEAKTARHPFSTREVERSLVMEKNWLEFGLGADVKVATGYWDAEGQPQEFDYAEWLYTTERLQIRYGLLPRAELFFSTSVHYMRLTNEHLGTDTADVGMGDTHIGWRMELLDRENPRSSVMAWVDYKGPSGKETPGVDIGGPNSMTGFVMSTGTPDFTAGVGGKRQFGPLAVIAHGGYTVRFGAVAQYVFETEFAQFGGRIKPGDIVFGDLGVLAQLGPVALQGGGLYQMRAPTRIGVGGDDFWGTSNLEEVQGSDGWSLDAQARAILNLTRGVDVTGGVDIPIRGEDLQFFPIEDIHPTRGPTYSFVFKFRY